MEPTWYFDGVMRRIYEVPPGATYTPDGFGYRIYNGGTTSPPILSVDVQKDLWSRWVDWHALNDWALPAFSKSGGSQRPTGEFSPVDFSLLTSIGWRLVLANYPHETILYGNLFSEGTDSLFDNTLLTNVGIVPRLQGSANLLTYQTSGGGGGSAGGATPTEIWNHPLDGVYTAGMLMRLMASVLAGKTLIVDNGDGTATVTFSNMSGLATAAEFDMEGSERVSRTDFV